MIIYEVNLDVDNDAAEDYAAWLDGHIREILTLDGFTGADWLEVESDDERKRWSVQYHLRDRESLENYFQHHAPRFRQDGLTRFAGRFTASRRVLAKRAGY